MRERKSRRDIRRTAGGATKDGSVVAMPDADQVDAYLAEIIGELERMARAHRKEMLAYLLSMASIQAIAPTAHLNSSRVLH
jgi:hypothetical protein